MINENVTLDDPAAYALWPARATAQGESPAERWAPGIRFTLVLRLILGADAATDTRQIEHTLRAWLLFGGIGGRTRRGCGALGIPDETARTIWLPESLDLGAIGAWLSSGQTANAVYPSLSGARLCIGQLRSATDTWHEAIGWLRDFRQGTNTARTDTATIGPFARQRSSLARGNAGRPGRSRWPEPDLIRHAFAAYDHNALIPANPISWPRAVFGLPIQFRFQNKDRSGNFFSNRPPQAGELGWSPTGDPHAPSQRLTSPLLVKPIQARNGKFAAAALWLSRTLPKEAVVGIKAKGSLRSPAPIGQMLTSPLFTPLTGKTSTEDAFMDWLKTNLRLTGGTL
ncbi:RAMP superfamily CRISPR-associated protein [uncultured Thiodictyon sp.]|uniref:RAMP superfamily CRISPR-associated protein n=1 Tax=uncultured Thiodictyon sp. TaxID=1846217 RepID=UPI0025D7F45D|nr:RAMP superfamily CRISPR-associated protein [uncultured Thiodictyon sp.]